ncbi:hypothetical protein NDU88_005418, partial [Pleurodeles waltl]
SPFELVPSCKCFASCSNFSQGVNVVVSGFEALLVTFLSNHGIPTITPTIIIAHTIPIIRLNQPHTLP